MTSLPDLTEEDDMGRRPVALTEEQRSEIETLAALLNQDQIADYLGIAQRTFRNLRERDPDIDARYKRGKARAIAHVAKGLLQKARSGDTTSMIFYLKTQAGWREADRIEHAFAARGTEADQGASAFLELALLVDRLPPGGKATGRDLIAAEALPPGTVP